MDGFRHQPFRKGIFVRHAYCRALALLLFVFGFQTMIYSRHILPANNPYIQYFGRWDMTDSLHPAFSWPGIYLCAEFTGTSIGIRIKDSINYYNVYIDGTFHSIFHGTISSDADYILAKNLSDSRHSFCLTRRNITFDERFSFSGIILDENRTLLDPPPKPSRKIEFIGDSFTAAESNEAKESSLPWEARFPVTDIDKGFAPLIAKHFHAQYTTTCRSGSGIVCDWQGNAAESIPARFDRTLMEVPFPKWDFTKWIPDVVFICLGLNDHSGLKGSSGSVSESNSIRFRDEYHAFLKTIRSKYPGIRIVAAAAFPEWIRKNVIQICSEEQEAGHADIFYTQFDEFPGGYVANGHPTVATHQKMAEQLIEAMESFHLFSPEK